ncbi:hypothetical protein M409DRAFT_19930 [Zasmidium cellare ATCC 36951]|uniref:C2H2-type domain-containing protein n=1 Tax=Zasmidium cellare ATCC 36951 TaxID=1080233 RepID=A0A6A6CVI0_ZASCE|nr:uncharacterized protein M409DRAFT_19930 [Zasmidium cellare ATCC 36951]KAF2169516.1 hypothetical protein M409DRAFT_19930 [Zasmidium cellare ATCC 36951]
MANPPPMLSCSRPASSHPPATHQLHLPTPSLHAETPILNRYCCPIVACNRTFDSYIAAYFHFCHHQASPYVVKCPEEDCPFAFRGFETLERHWDVIHNEDFLVYNCIVPGCGVGHPCHEEVVEHLVRTHGMDLPTANTSKQATIVRRQVNCQDWFLARGYPPPDPSFVYPRRPGAAQRPSKDYKNSQLNRDLQIQEAQRAALTEIADRRAATLYHATISKSLPIRRLVPSVQMPPLLAKAFQERIGGLQHHDTNPKPPLSLRQSTFFQKSSMSHHQHHQHHQHQQHQQHQNQQHQNRQHHHQHTPSQHASASSPKWASRVPLPIQNRPMRTDPRSVPQLIRLATPQQLLTHTPAKRKRGRRSNAEVAARKEAAAASGQNALAVADSTTLPPATSGGLLLRPNTQEQDVMSEAVSDSEYVQQRIQTSLASGGQISARARPPASLPVQPMSDVDAVNRAPVPGNAKKVRPADDAAHASTQAQAASSVKAKGKAPIANDKEPESLAPPAKRGRGRPRKNADNAGPSHARKPSEDQPGPAAAQARWKWSEPVEDIIALNHRRWLHASSEELENIRLAIQVRDDWQRISNAEIWKHMTETWPRECRDSPEVVAISRQLKHWASRTVPGINPRRAGGYMRVCLKKFVKHYPMSIYVEPMRWLQCCALPQMVQVIAGPPENDWKPVVVAKKVVCERGVMRGIKGMDQADIGGDRDLSIRRCEWLNRRFVFLLDTFRKAYPFVEQKRFPFQAHFFISQVSPTWKAAHSVSRHPPGPAKRHSSEKQNS